MVSDTLASVEPKMAKALDYLNEELKSLRGGRASTGLVDGLTIDLYGQSMVLKQVATISTPDAHTIAITPWDKAALPIIEKAIRENQSLGLNPASDGNAIRVNVPPMTAERRQQIIKQLGEKTEQCHISLRNIRHEALDEARKLEKSKQATIDDVRSAENQLNRLIEQYRVKIEQIEKAKTAELLEV